MICRRHSWGVRQESVFWTYSSKKGLQVDTNAKSGRKLIPSAPQGARQRKIARSHRIPTYHMIGVKSRRRHFGNDFFDIDMIRNTKGCIHLRRQPYFTPVNHIECRQFHQERRCPRNYIGEIQTRKRMIGRDLEDRINPTNTKSANTQDCNDHRRYRHTHAANGTGSHIHQTTKKIR